MFDVRARMKRRYVWESIIYGPGQTPILWVDHGEERYQVLDLDAIDPRGAYVAACCLL
jgi:hypothetical protein